jgi:hypothetical protein
VHQVALLRSHWTEFDVVWLADCKATEQHLYFRLGYFHRLLPKQIWVYGPDKGVGFLLDIPRGLYRLPDPAPVTEEGQLDILSTQINL